MEKLTAISIPSLLIIATVGLLSACGDKSAQVAETQTQTETAPPTEPLATVAPASTADAVSDKGFTTTEVTKFTSPWAMSFLPDGRLLVTEMAGTLRLLRPRQQQDRPHQWCARSGSRCPRRIG